MSHIRHTAQAPLSNPLDGITPDFERVLQNAIADINASVSGATAGPPGLSQKRHREEHDAEMNANGHGEGEPRKKKKKKKLRDSGEGAGGRDDAGKAKQDKGKERAPTTLPTFAPPPPPIGAPNSPPYDEYIDASQFIRPPWEMDSPAVVPQAVEDLLPPSFFNVGVPPMPIPPGTNSTDLIRALQQIDLSKFASSLRAMSGDLVPQPAATTSAAASTVAQAARHKTTNGDHRKSAVGLGAALQRAVAASQEYDGLDHATLLATKWLNPTKLAELVVSHGLHYKKGKFSTVEEEMIGNALEGYRIQRNMSVDALRDVIFAKGKKAREANSTFWSEITTSVPQRPIIAVYHHVRRTWHPLKRLGKWSTEEDAALRDAVVEYGQQWEKISEKVGRMSSDCRDRFRNHIQHRESRVFGPWTEDEEEELTRIVRELTTDQGKNAENDIFWGVVSERMGNRRTRQQCRIKWTDALNKRVKNDGNKPRWSGQDAYILVQKIASLKITHDSEIDWKLIADSDWNLWSAHQLQRRWFRMKKGVKNGETMPFLELITILKDKKSLPLASTISRQPPGSKLVKSKATISDDEDMSEVEQGLVTPADVIAGRTATSFASIVRNDDKESEEEEEDE
ncbi:hypothetical protein CALCODRAFT_492038 [Calocera cornea HHB12733]|uniref:Uncharacterized protein n=1 Tax=Calocera cornea HHB12733 TaxID=1353952 RepID=A0A165IMU1_9BASI|nr:hypothetical protein CALCODRAFT_492038 [Calocera cornea HHB12733]